MLLPLLIVAASAQTTHSHTPAAVLKQRPPGFHLPVLEQDALQHKVSPQIRRMQLYSPGAISTYNGYTSVQVNVDSQGNNIVGDAANEPSMAIDPLDPNHIAIAWREFESVGSNFREGGYAYSFDRGKTWTFPGEIEQGTFRSDPVLDTGSNGLFYWDSLLETFYSDVWNSPNGAAWTEGSADGAANGGDKQWFAVDKTSGPSNGYMYQFWSTAGNNFGGRQFDRSLDGGQTWSDPQFLPQNVIWGTPSVAANGDLYYGGTLDDGSQFWFLKSTDAKTGTATPTWSVSTPVNLGGYINYGENINPDGLVGMDWLINDSSASSPYSGNIYMGCSVWVDNTDQADVMFARSTDGGNTWQNPVRINDDPKGQNAYHWMASIGVAPNGRLDAVWLDTRNDPTAATSQLYYSQSFDGGVTWSKNIPVSQAFNQSVGYPQQNKMGDYMTVLSDNSYAHVAYAATFNNEEDVYYLEIPAVAPTAVDDSYSTIGAPSSPSALTVTSANGVLANDTGVVTSASLVSNPSNAGSFNFNSDGSFTYTPNAGFYGTDSFTYQAVNATGNSNTATVSITVQPILLNVTMDANSTFGGSSLGGTINLTGNAPSGGASITVGTSDGNASITSPVSISAGSSSAPITVNTSSVTATDSETITATYNGSTQTATFTIYPASPPLTGVSLATNSVYGSYSTTGTVTIATIAPPAGTVVTLSSNNANVQVPANTTVASGQTTAQFNVTTTDPSSGTVTATISASANGHTVTAPLTVNRIYPTALAFSPTSVTGGVSDSGNVTLSTAAGPSGVAVSLTSGNSHAQVPSSITVANGHTTNSFTITTTPVSNDTAINIMAKCGGASITKAFTVLAPRLASISFASSTVYAKRYVAVTFKLNGNAPANGMQIKLNSSPGGVLGNPANVTVPAGTYSYTVNFVAFTVKQPTVVTLTGTVLNSKQSASITVEPASQGTG